MRRLTQGLGVVLGLLVWGMVSGQVWAGDWPQWRGPERDGKAVGEKIRTDWKNNPPQLDWIVDGMGGGYASVSIVDGRLFTTGNIDGAQAVIAVEAATGKPVWKTPITSGVPKHGYGGSRCTPTIDGDRLYAVTSDGQISCLRVDDGRVLWQRKFQQWGGRMMSGWGFSESPLIDGDRVVCTPGGSGGVIVALDKQTGKEIWKSRLPESGDQSRGKDGAGYSSIVISDGGGVKQYVQLIGRGVIGVRASDGQFLWGYNKVANSTANIPTPVVSGDYVFASSGYGTGACLLRLKEVRGKVSAEEVYFLDAKTFQNHHGGMILDGGHVYAGHQHNKGFPICVEMRSGRIAWGGRIRPVGSGSAAVTFVDGQLIFRYQDGVVALIQATPSGYELHGSFKPEYQERESWSHPVVVDGKLYLREQDKLMCYDISR